MWFNQLMESCKRATRLLWSRPGLLLPWLLGIIALGGATVVLAIIGVILAIPLIIVAFQGGLPFLMLGLLLIGGGIAILMALLWSTFYAGYIAMLQGALAGEASLSDGFWRGVRTLTWKMWSTNLLLILVIILSSPLLVLAYLLAGAVSLLSGGVALIALNLLWFVFLHPWPVVVAAESKGGFFPLRESLRMGRERFALMFLLALTSSALPMMALNLGPLGFLLAGWLVGIVVTTWLRLVVILEYHSWKQSSWL
jgi:hypothetical protein